MPEAVLEFHPDVEPDLEEVFAFIAADNEHYAELVTESIRKCIDGLRFNPRQGPPYRSSLPSLTHVHRLVVIPYRRYLVFYKIEGDVVRILYVHAADRSFEKRHTRGQRS